VSEPPLVEGEIAPELAEEWPGLRLASMTFPFAAGPSPPELRDQLRLLSDRFRGPQAIALRQQPVTQAYRIFFRHVGLEPDDRLVPVEALALERLKHGGFRSRSLLDDAITIAVMETRVPVWALDAAAVEGDLRLRAAEPGEEVPRGRLIVAGGTRPLVVLFDDPGPDVGVTERTREMVLFSVAVPGVPPIHVEEALWTVWDTVASH
jgi:DNA/RNA-binding domain of Phe-tRNA-synthetase-like protein